MKRQPTWGNLCSYQFLIFCGRSSARNPLRSRRGGCQSVYMFSPRQVGNDPAIDSDEPMSDVFHVDPFTLNDTIDAGLIRKTSQPQAGIDIEKATNGQDADSPTGPVIPVGETATFTYVVTNTGNVALSGVEVIDDAGTPNVSGDDFNPHFTGGDSNSNDLLSR